MKKNCLFFPAVCFFYQIELYNHVKSFDSVIGVLLGRKLSSISRQIKSLPTMFFEDLLTNFQDLWIQIEVIFLVVPEEEVEQESE